MIAVLSPAKNMLEAKTEGAAVSAPVFLKEAEALAGYLKGLQPYELETLLNINPELAMKAFISYQNFGGAKKSPAVLSYHGLAYRHLDAGSFSPETLLFANKRLRILSALYGVLRPLDGISPYRLEFQCGVRVNGASLYDFWGDQIYRELFRTGEPVVNLASKEYSRAVFPYLTNKDRWITCDFLTFRRGKLTTLAALAKMARGRMASFIAVNRINSPEGLKGFEWNGYTFSEERSDCGNFRFIQN